MGWEAEWRLLVGDLRKRTFIRSYPPSGSRPPFGHRGKLAIAGGIAGERMKLLLRRMA